MDDGVKLGVTIKGIAQMQGGSFTQRRKDAKEESGLTWRTAILVFFASLRLERSGRETFHHGGIDDFLRKLGSRP